MSLVVRFFVFWMLVFGSAFAQDYSNTLEGTYPVASQSFIPLTVNFTLQWNETGNRIDGVYTDNYFATSAPVTGTTTAAGRAFSVVFAAPAQGVKAIKLGTNQVGIYNGNVTTSVTTLNAAGVPVDIANITSNMNSRVLNPTLSGVQDCVVGFGVLSGFCGQYSGTITEVQDPQNRCHLTGQGPTKLEMGFDSQIKLFSNVVDNNLKGMPSQPIGKLPPSPLSGNVNLRNRICGPVANTNFPNRGCQILNLTGAFQDIGDTLNFTGTYTITDDYSRYSCRYEMNINRDIAY